MFIKNIFSLDYQLISLISLTMTVIGRKLTLQLKTRKLYLH